ncbi:MAG: heavy-metal-associated domain-containing protein [Clostridiales bacterium]|nr:heavy-metal-associated domain-containing protein [Clostridiales bacterium]
MKKKFKLSGLDCANCAAKMEDSIKKIDGVNDASISFFTEKMTIEADENNFNAVVEEAAKRISAIEPDCKIAK